MSFLGKFGQAIGTFAKSALGLSVIPSAVQLAGNAISAARERKFAKEMWTEQNRYNSPVQQLARYREAGMNPAYGAGMSSGDAAPMPQAAASVAKLDMPNILAQLGQYQSMMNAVKENEKIAEQIKGIQLANKYLDESMDYRVEQTKFLRGLTSNKMDETYYKKNWMRQATEEGRNPFIVKHQLDSQALEQRNQLFKYDLEVAERNANLARMGLTPTDSPLLRIIGQIIGANKLGSWDFEKTYKNWMNGN